MLFLLLGDGGHFFLTLLIFLLIGLAIPALFFFAVSATRGTAPRPEIAALTWAAAIWFLALIAGALLGRNDTYPLQLVVGIVLTTVLALRGGYDLAWMGWVLLFALGPVGTVVLLWRRHATRAATPDTSTPNSSPNFATPSPTGNADGTTTVDMAPEVRQALRRRSWRWIGLALLAIGLLVQAYLATTASAENQSAEGALMLRLIFGGFVGLGFLILAVSMELRLEQDLGATSFLRTSGTVRSASNFWHARGERYMRVWVGDVELSDLNGLKADGSPLVGMDWATVDYTKRSRYLLSVRDRTGAVQYSVL